HNEEKVLERHYMKAETVEELWGYGDKHKLLTWMVTPEKLYRYSARPSCFFEYEWLKFGYGNLEQSMIDTLTEKLSFYNDIEITSSSSNNIEINRKGVNKVRAIEKICNELEITLDNVMAIGDNLNDLQMIKQVGLGVAVGNATSQLKEHAKYVTDSNDLNGVAHAINKFVIDT